MLNAETVKLCCFLLLPVLIFAPQNKVWKISVDNQGVLKTNFENQVWKKKFNSIDDALVEARTRWFEKAQKSEYVLPAIPEPFYSAYTYENCDHNNLLNNSDIFPVTMHPVFSQRSQRNQRSQAVSDECAAWFDRRTSSVQARWLASGECVIFDANIEPLLYKEVSEIVFSNHRLAFLIRFTRHEVIFCDVFKVNELEMPWSARGQILENVTAHTTYCKTLPHVVVHNLREYEGNLKFYRNTPNITGVEVREQKKAFGWPPILKINF